MVSAADGGGSTNLFNPPHQLRWSSPSTGGELSSPRNPAGSRPFARDIKKTPFRVFKPGASNVLRQLKLPRLATLRVLAPLLHK